MEKDSLLRQAFTAYEELLELTMVGSAKLVYKDKLAEARRLAQAADAAWIGAQQLIQIYVDNIKE